MKESRARATSKEAREAIGKYTRHEFEGVVLCGQESDGDMVVLVDPAASWGRRLASALDLARRSLAKKYGEKYRLYVVDEFQLKSYKADSGWEEVAVEGEVAELFPISATWVDNYAVIATDGVRRVWAVSDEALGEFCMDCLEKIQTRKGAK